MWRFIFTFLLIAFGASGEVLTLPASERPEWVARDGIVMAGSWEPLLFRVRRDQKAPLEPGQGYVPTPEQLAGYEREHSPEMVAELKKLGVNFVMMHCYKGAGLEAEKNSMDDAVKFSRLCHDSGLRVGTYTYSGAFLWELFFKERPDAQDWVLLDKNEQPVTYGGSKYRYYWNRNNPNAQEFYKGIVKFAIEDIQTDLVHLDNYVAGPGLDADSKKRFQQYLTKTFTPDELATEGIEPAAPDSARKAMTARADNLIGRAWLNFHAESLADSYSDMCRYARSLKKDVLFECNPGGPGDYVDPLLDHGRLLQGGDAFWDEGGPAGYVNGKLQTRIRTYKIARVLDNMAFLYTTTPLEMAESMAFNRDCLGCICWFEYGKIVDRPGSKNPLVPETQQYVNFFHDRRDLLRNARVVADVAVLRSYPSQSFGQPSYRQLTSQVEKELIENRVPFQIVFDHQLGDLKRYSVLVLADCVAMSDKQIADIEAYKKSGGRVCINGSALGYDEWMRPRGQAQGNLPAMALLDQIKQECGGRFSITVDAPAGVCAEFTEQPNRRLVHLVNYRVDKPISDVKVRMKIPDKKQIRRVAVVNPEDANEKEITFSIDGDTVFFNVPKVEVYSVALIAWV